MKKLSGRELSTEERRLWNKVATGVRARRGGRPEPQETPEAALPPTRSVRATLQHAPKAAPAPTNREGEKRVRRGKLEIGASLDLHGFTQSSGRAALTRFLHAAYARGDRTVVVITGVGRQGGGILKRSLPEWIAERGLREIVSGYAQAHRSHGGAGAFYIFLRKSH